MNNKILELKTKLDKKSNKLNSATLELKKIKTDNEKNENINEENFYKNILECFNNLEKIIKENKEKLGKNNIKK